MNGTEGARTAMTIFPSVNWFVFFSLLMSIPSHALSQKCIEMGNAKMDGFDKSLVARYEQGACKLREKLKRALKASSCYRSVKDQERACSGICGNKEGCPGKCARPGNSYHQGGYRANGAQNSAGHQRVACDFDGLNARKAEVEATVKEALGTVGTRCYGRTYVRHIDNNKTPYTDKNGVCP